MFVTLNNEQILLGGEYIGPLQSKITRKTGRIGKKIQ